VTLISSVASILLSYECSRLEQPKGKQIGLWTRHVTQFFYCEVELEHTKVCYLRRFEEGGAYRSSDAMTKIPCYKGKKKKKK
jgi:hypothetical protein